MKKYPFINLLNLSLFVISLILCGLIYIKDPDFSYFKTYKSKINLFTTSLFTHRFFQETTTVSTSISYTYLGSACYTNENHFVTMITSGVVMDIEYISSLYSLIINFDNEMVLSLKNLMAIEVKKFDILLENDLIGYFDEYFIGLLRQNGKLILLNEIYS